MKGEIMAGTEVDCVVQQGRVEKIEDGRVFVNIVSMSACASCHARGMCNMSDIQEKLIEAQNPNHRNLKVGDVVNLEMQTSLGKKAVLLGYFYPFLLVLGVLIALTSGGVNEGVSGLVALGLLVPYYTMLYLMRDKMKKDFTFKIR